MTINTAVNFLPWRRRQFTRVLWRWGLLVCSSWLVCACIAFYAALYWQADRNLSEVYVSAEQRLRQQMSQREQLLNVKAQQNAQAQKRRLNKEMTEAWSSRLGWLAEHLPEQAWLTELTYHRGVLSLAGVLTQFSALAVADRELQHVPGFLPGKAGKIVRGNDGYWQFQYQLPEGVANAAP